MTKQKICKKSKNSDSPPATKNFSAYGASVEDAIQQMFSAGKMPKDAKVSKDFMLKKKKKLKVAK